MDAIEPELITIIEGPAPEFRPAMESWAYGLAEGAVSATPSRSQMRTFNGPELVERCTRAWREGRPVILDFPDSVGLRRRVEVTAARWEAVTEGHVLHLWVRLD
jgi:hypothetical protein